MSDGAAVFARVVAEMIGAGAEPEPPERFATRFARGASDLCPGAEVAVMLLGQGDEPPVISGSTPRAHAFLELGMRLAEGPAHQALTTGRRAATVALRDRAPSGSRPGAQLAGCETVHTVLIRGAGEPIGVIEVLASSETGDLGFLEPLADVVGGHLTRQAELQAAQRLAGQLETALRDRVVIEQAKGMISQNSRVPLESAFGSLRRYARNHNQRLTELAESIASGETDLASIPVDYFPMSAPRRRELRERALDRLHETRTETLRHRERASRSASRSVELRLELENARALRRSDALGRAMDRQLREDSLPAPTTKQLPRVLVREQTGPLRSFVLDALREDARFDVHSAPDDAEILGRSVVEQPDLVIVRGDGRWDAPGVPRPVGDGDSSFLDDLRRYCPDSRTLLVAGGPETNGGLSHHVALWGTGVYDGVVSFGDARALVTLTAKLCGLRG